MSSWSKLPFDVLYCILNQLDKSDHFNCTVVCKGWHKPFQDSFYKNVKLCSQSQLNSFAECMAIARDKVNTCELVKSISIGNDLSIPENFLFDLLQHCTNLKTITTPSTPSGSFFNQVTYERGQGKCLALEKIPFPDYERSDDVKNYTDAAWALRDRLKTLMMCDTILTLQEMDGSSMVLKSFPRLESLTYVITSTDNLYNIGSIIQESQSLESLSVVEVYSISLEGNDDISTPASFDLVEKPFDNIKTFKGIELYPTEKLFKYMMCLFPKLDHVELSFVEREILLKSALLEQLFISANIANQFLLHVYNNMDTFVVAPFLVKDVEGVLNRFIGSTDFSGALEICYQFGEIDAYPSEMWINKMNQDCLVNVSARFSALASSYSILPHTKLIQQFGRNLKMLALDFGSVQSQFDGALADDVNGYCFDHIFKYCRELETLEISNMMPYKCNPEMVKGTPLEVLTFHNCNLSGSWLADLSERIPRISVFNAKDCSTDNGSRLDLSMIFSSVDTIIWTETSNVNSWMTDNGFTEFHITAQVSQGYGYGLDLSYSGNKTKVVQRSFEDSDDENENELEMDDDKLKIYIDCRGLENFILNSLDLKFIIKNIAQSDEEIFIHPSKEFDKELENFMKLL